MTRLCSSCFAGSDRYDLARDRNRETFGDLGSAKHREIKVSGLSSANLAVVRILWFQRECGSRIANQHSGCVRGITVARMTVQEHQRPDRVRRVAGDTL